ERAGGVDIFNVGGGIPVNYSSSDKYDFKDYVEVISRAINTYLVDVLKGRSGSKEQMIAIEPGRAIVAEAVDLIIPIMAVEEGDNPAVYFNDGIYTSFIDHAVHKWTYNFETMRKDGLPHRGRKKLYTLFGRTCDSGDTLGEVMLPEDIREGDYIWVSSAGAYMDSLANPFHDFKPPKYIIYN
ncbi:hypothetical protein KJ951_03745, partial [Patescibacteria group bacterium]|nr:hypothetical protein [Patescibacteria group bacterium]MBU1703490.1 hypothetical protein [Patescibacteria group bacterium]